MVLKETVCDTLNWTEWEAFVMMVMKFFIL
jgi:hypothetical protein